jgi:hypothetical protein
MKPLASIDNHTVPSSCFTRPSTNVETISSPPPYTSEATVFSRAPYSYQRNYNNNSINDSSARQIDIPTMNGLVTRAKDG